jgi:ATP-dependent HslUV protease, peptidase subunit HslV
LSERKVWRSTTVVGLRHNGESAMAADGQVTFGDTIVKSSARKVRRLYDDQVLAGFAGASSDAFTLFERFEAKLDEYNGALVRAAVELAKDWRMDRALRRLEAMLAVMDREHSLIISGNGDVVEPDDGIVSIGSGGPFALSAARALLNNAPQLTAEEMVRRSMEIASSICIFTNSQIMVETLSPLEPGETPVKSSRGKPGRKQS